jgi:hypothetical protein
MSRFQMLVLFGLLAGFPRFGSSQLCNGQASFAHAPYQASGNAVFNKDAKTFGAGFAFGGVGPFAQLNLGTTSYDGLDGSSLNLGAEAGYQVSLDKKGVFHLCPTAAFGFSSGPNNLDVFGDGSVVIDLKQTDFSFGIGVGAVASRSDQAQIIPNASVSFVSATLKATDDVSGQSQSTSETFGIVGFGLGFVFNQVVSFHPGVAIPVGLNGASVTFGATVSVNFGRR